MARKHPDALPFDTIRLEGALFVPDLLEQLTRGEGHAQETGDYHLPRGISLVDEQGRAFQIARAQWLAFASKTARQDIDALALTVDFIQELLTDSLRYALESALTVEAGGRTYPVPLMAHGRVPVFVAPHSIGLDESSDLFPVQGSGSRRRSVFRLAQEFLAASPNCTWALVSNGRRLRLLRDAATLTRPCFLEFDLETILDANRYPDFAALWRLLHSSRASATVTDACIWEDWRNMGLAQGTRVRDGLRAGVTQALIVLGTGFLRHPGNGALRARLQDGALTPMALFQELLRLAYRCLFLFTLEERTNESGISLLHPPSAGPEAQTARRLYCEGYSFKRLRARALRPSSGRYHDLWQGVVIVFHALHQGEARLALPALGGLFAPDQCPNLDACSLSNQHLLAAIRKLRWARIDGNLALIDYRNMGPEELGSIYESLLELAPSVDLSARKFGFAGITDESVAAGNARKLTGSYYTPDSLVQELIKSALDPVIKARIASRPEAPAEALLDLTVLDPACGSGHFLLAAARRLAEQLAELRTVDGGVRPEEYRRALREIINHCIFGVDKNPMALELARFALWLEGFEPGRPLSFLDHHLICGDALVGLFDLKVLQQGVPQDAYKALSGDDKTFCRALAKSNAAAIKAMERSQRIGNLWLPDESYLLREFERLEALPNDTCKDIVKKERAWRETLQKAEDNPYRQAADLAMAAWLLPKQAGAAIPASAEIIAVLYDQKGLDGQPLRKKKALQELIVQARAACEQARVLHWPLAFPQVFAQGGFDCVLGNPPWERIKLQEEEFFATRHRDIAEARNKAERARRIQWLSEGMLARHLYPDLAHETQEDEAEQRLYAEFITARRAAEATSGFAHVEGEDGGRYPLTGVGDVNTYALFAETILQIHAATGRAGFIVPTGIATDDSTKAFFAHITQNKRLVSLYDIENRDNLFPAVDSRMKFCLLTLGHAEQAEFVCFATQVNQLADPRRRFTLTPEEFRLINPNTLTCPVFRSERDAELTKKLYRSAPVLIDDNRPDGNPWGISFMAMLHMSNDSHLFKNEPAPDRLPLYEAKLIHQFDHRWATYAADGASRDLTAAEKQNPAIAVTPRYWVDRAEVEERLCKRGRDGRVIWQWERNWLMGWRDITNATNERTVIASVAPRVGVGNNMPLMLLDAGLQTQKAAALLGNLCSLVLDFVARHKTGGTHMNYFIFKQLPVLPPDHYTESDIAFIVPRVLELTYTAHDLTDWAQDLGYDGSPFPFDPTRRTTLRAELDAYYARLYGLTRDELRYILDPADVMGEDYPSETFRVLKDKEMREFGKYRTQRLALEAWDKLERGIL